MMGTWVAWMKGVPDLSPAGHTEKTLQDRSDMEVSA